MSHRRPSSSARELAPKLRYHSTTDLPVGRMLRLGVISNPLSGGNRKGLEAVRNLLTGQPQVTHRQGQTPAEVASALTEFGRNETDIVVINGGDGTIQATLTALFLHQPFDRLPLLAVLRSGTDSIIARDVGLSGSRDRALRRLLGWTRNGDRQGVVLKRQVLRVQAWMDQDPLYGLIFGAAAIYQGIQYCKSKVHTLGARGELAPVLTLARFLLALALDRNNVITSVPMTIGLDQNPHEQRNLLFLIVSTLERLFLRIRPYWGVENAPLRFTAITDSPRYLFRALPFLVRGKQNRYGTEEYGYFSHNVHEVRLEFKHGFTLDGELYTPDPTGAVVVQDGGQASFLRL
jgi:diacylglycerol kinase (ATP)